MYFVLIASIPDKSMRAMSNKALVRVHKDIFINHQIKNILKINKRAKVIVLCAFEHKKIMDQCIKHNRVKYIHHKYDEYSNIGESMKCIMDNIPDNEDVHVVNLPMVVDPNIFKNIKPNKSSVIINKSNKFQSKIGCTINLNNTIEFIFYDLPNKTCEYLFISKSDIIAFKDLVKTHIKNNMYLFEIINAAIKINMSIEAYNVNHNIIHFNSVDQITAIGNLYKKIYNNVAI